MKPDVGDGVETLAQSGLKKEIKQESVPKTAAGEVEPSKGIGLRVEAISANSKFVGPILQEKIAYSFKDGHYNNRKLLNDEMYYRYHGIDNRKGERFSWLTNKKYTNEVSLRADLAIRDDWEIKIEMVTEFKVPSGTWISEGYAAPQGIGYPGGGHQAAILEVPKHWIQTTKQAFN